MSRVLRRVVDFNYVCNLFITFARKYCAIVLLLLAADVAQRLARKRGRGRAVKI